MVTRRAFATLCLAGLAGCAGGDGDTPANPAVGDVTPTGGLELTSPAFEDGGSIPAEYGRRERNVNPPLRIGGVPDGARSLALLVDDPDAPDGPFLHWLVWNVDPTVREIPAGWSPENAVVGTNDFGNRRYDGPQPPSGVHTYRFKCYALDARLDLTPDATLRRVGEALGGALLAATQLEGTYRSR